MNFAIIVSKNENQVICKQIWIDVKKIVDFLKLNSIKFKMILP